MCRGIVHQNITCIQDARSRGMDYWGNRTPWREEVLAEGGRDQIKDADGISSHALVTPTLSTFV